MKCCESKCFHVIASAHNTTPDFSSRGGFKSFKDKNAFAPLVNRGVAIAEKLDIKIQHADYDDVELNIAHDFSDYFGGIEKKLTELDEAKTEAENLLEQHTQVLSQLEQLAGLSSDFEEIFACRYIHVRFGRLPVDSYPKLRYYENREFFFFPFESTKEYVWGMYLATDKECIVIDDIFKSLYFERVRIPEYLHGTADEAKTVLIQMIREETDKLKELEEKLKVLSDDVKTGFIPIFNKLNALSESYDIRKNVSLINNQFYLSGYVPQRCVRHFTDTIEEVEGVKVVVRPHDAEVNAKPPVKLRNNRVFRPFEMFVEMYGLPTYGTIDPTPLVAITYMLMYGIMFGDLGQGLVISALGILLTFWKHAKLGPVMTRLGVSSAIFGTLYGSVFGNEELITPFFHIKPVYEALGYNEAPENIFTISTILLITALVLGAVLIMISMLLNIAVNIKNRDVEKWLLGANGIVGLVFYASLLIGAGLQLGFGMEMLTAPYVLGLIILPIVIMFFKEPIAKKIEKAARNRHGFKMKKSNSVLHAVKSYSDAVSQYDEFCGGNIDFTKLMECELIQAQYGQMPKESYEKLNSYKVKEFVFLPFETVEDKLSGVYIAQKSEFQSVARMFEGLGFDRGKMPDNIRGITKETKRYLKKSDNKNEETEKKSVGTFIIESFIEMFETALSYITNTMSFLRVGGFILSHAGMMLVVGVLATSAGDASIVVQILGNAFVIGMEGFLVGIQVLRLEFYELFSRFYVSDGTPFRPVEINFNTENN